MDLMTILGLALGIFAVYYTMQAGGIANLIFNLPALVLVGGGTIASTLITYPWSVIKRIPKAMMFVLFPQRRLPQEWWIRVMVELAEIAKRSGIDALQGELPRFRDHFLVNGLQMVIDGLDPELVRENLEKEITFIRRRHQQIHSVFRSMGAYAPIFGLLGTLIGVVGVLKNLTDPQAIGDSMAIAVITTFYGIFGTNFIFLPIANKLSAYTEQELLIKEVMIEGILSIQAGDIPLIVNRKLQAFLAYKLRATRRTGGGGVGTGIGVPAR